MNKQEFVNDMESLFGNKVSKNLIENAWEMMFYGVDLPIKLIKLAYDARYYPSAYKNLT